MTVPYTFATATTSLPLNQLDSNFNTPITLGNTAIYLGNTTTFIGNLALGNVAVSSGNVIVTSVTTTNLSASNVVISSGTITNVTIANVTYGNVSYSNITTNTLSIGVSGQVAQIGQGDSSRLKNRIINGAMVIDQRNAGASVAIGNTTVAGNYYFYTVDRWAAQSYTTTAGTGVAFTVQQNNGSVTPPVGFTNYLGVNITTARSPAATTICRLETKIEGFNIADLGWGTANAKTVTLSFQVYSSLTGTFGGVLQNSSSSRSYPFTYSVSSANTWTSVSVTIAGDTSGTWLTTNGVGIDLIFALGTDSASSGTAGSWSGNTYYGATGQTQIIATSGATFYITGVQLEVGSSATGYEYRQYQQELALCQRYYQKLTASGAYTAFGSGSTISTTQGNIYIKFANTMRSAPTMNFSSLVVQDSATNGVVTSISSLFAGSDSCLAICVISGVTANRPAYLSANNSSSAYVDFSAEL
jgi:hypothetical protein